MKETLIRHQTPQHLIDNYLDGIEFEELDHFKAEAHKLYPENKELGR